MCKSLILQLIRQFSKPLSPLPVDREQVTKRFRGVPSLPYGSIPCPVILFDLYGTLLQSVSGDIGRFQLVESTPTGPTGKIPEVANPVVGIEPLVPFLPLLPREGTLQTLRMWFRQEVEKRHKDLRNTYKVPEIRVEEVWGSILRLPEEDAFEFALRFELTVNPVYPMPGAREYLAMLKKNGVLLGLVSNAQAFTPYYVEALFGASLEDLGFFTELTIFSYKIREAKPSPRLFHMAAETLASMGYLPGNALYCGNDLKNDVWAPQQAGFQAALFCGDKRSLRLYEDDSRLAQVKPDYLIESFERGEPCM